MIKDIFSEEIILEDERARLRPIEENDFSNLLPFSLAEPEIWKWGLVTAEGEENLRNYLKQAVLNRKEGKEYTFIIYDKQKQAYAGSTRFYDIQPAYGSTQLGYTWYGKDFQRTGLNRHCKLLIFEFCFEKWGLERVELRAHAANQRSIDAMQSIGCIMEGRLRSHMPTVDGSRRDSVVLSVLKEEWFSGVKQLIQSKAK
jgi:RimJ/RimL family protein N-acetyltransferase